MRGLRALQGRLFDAPDWTRGLVTGVWFGATFAAVQTATATRWPSALVTGAFGGICFGLITGSYSARQKSRIVAVIGVWSAAQRRVIFAAAGARGPVPTDPGVRAAGARLAAWRYERASRTRWACTALFGFYAAMSVVIWLRNGWGVCIPAAVGFLALAVRAVVLPERLRRRESLLQRAQRA